MCSVKGGDQRENWWASNFGCDRMNSSQRTVLTSAAARARREPAASLGMGSQELGGSSVLAVLSQTGSVVF